MAYFYNPYLPEYRSIATAKESLAANVSLRIPVPATKAAFEEVFNLPNLTYLFLDAGDCNGVLEVPDNTAAAQNLKVLRLENFSFLPRQIELPPLFLQLPQLEQLEFSRCLSLDWNNFNSGRFDNLRRLHIFACSDFSAWRLDNIPLLEEWLIDSTCSAIPTGLGQLHQLKKLFLRVGSIGKSIPKEIAQLPELEHVELMVRDVIPDWVSELNPNLKYLDVQFEHTRSFGTITEHIFNYKKLEKLALVGIGLEQLSPKIAQLQQLKELRIMNNYLQSLPDELAQLGELTHLNIYHNLFKRLPTVIKKLPKLLVLGVSEDLEKPFNAFFDWVKNAALPADFQQFVINVWDGKAAHIEKPDYQLLEKALFSGIRPINERILNYLVSESPQAYHPFQQGDVLAVITNIKTLKTKLKTKLKAQGVTVLFMTETQAWDSRITHVLIDEKKQLHVHQWLGKEGVILMEESQLNDFLNAAQPDYLVQDAQQSQQSEMVERVNQLLFSLDDANIKIALGLMKSGGVPETCKTALFTAYKLAADTKTRSAAGKMLQLVASKALLEAMKKRINFINPFTYMVFEHEIVIFKNTEIDLLLFAEALFLKCKNGSLEAYIAKEKKSRQLSEKLQQAIADGTLIINVGEYLDKRIPKEITSLQNLRKLSIYRWSDCKPLDELFPKGFEKLDLLESIELNYSATPLRAIPPMFLVTFAKLSALHSINMPDLTEKSRSELQIHLPNCKIS